MILCFFYSHYHRSTKFPQSKRFIFASKNRFQSKRSVAPKGVCENYFYTISKEKFNDVTTDDNGAYVNSRSNKRYYFAEIEDGKLINVKIVHSEKEKYFLKERNGKEYNMVEVDSSGIIEKTKATLV